MEMTQIRYFIAVSETLNFTRAAEQCFISQPALTKGIKKLEASIGGELLHRTKNSVGLSYLGKQLLPKFQKIYHDATIAKEEAKRLITESDSTLRIGIQDSVFIGSVLPMLQGFQAENLGIKFEFMESEKYCLKDKLEFHELDIIFLSRLDGVDMKDHETVVFKEDFVIAFGDQHRFSDRSVISLQELMSERYCLRTHCNSSTHLENELLSRGIEVNVVYSSARDDWVRSFVSGNFGVTLLPESQAICEGMRYVKFSDFQVSRSVVLRTCSKVNQLVPCRKFLSALPLLTSEYCRQLDSRNKIDEGMLPRSTVLERGVNVPFVKAC
jgi:DNA-binding transcriptional LysR family regulator